MEVDLVDMAGDAEISSDIPLIQNESSEDLEHQEHDSTSLHIFVWVLSLTAGISGILFGYDTGVISSTLVSVDTDLTHPLTTLDKSLITSCTSFAALVASLIAGILADKFGRWWIILVADVLFILGALWQAFATTVAGMIVGRSLVGFAIGAASLVVPLYISELSPSAYRGRMVTLSILLVTAGQVVAYSVGWILSTRKHGWRFMVGFGAAPAVLQLGLLMLLPETPRWLVRNDKKERARSVLRQVYRESDAVADQVLQAISSEVAEETSAAKLSYTSASDARSPLWLTKLRLALVKLSSDGSSRRALIIACLLQGLQQLCGFNSLMYFSATIFALLGFSSPTLTSLSIAVTNFISTLVALVLVDRIGRRRILLVSIPIMVTGLLSCSISYHFMSLGQTQTQGTRTSRPPMSSANAPPIWALLILIALIIYVCGYAVGLGNIAWQQSELFPLSVRSLGSGLATATNWGCNFLVGLTFLPMMQFLTPTWTFFTYAVICLLGWWCAWKVYPETRGIGLEEMKDLLKDGWGVKESLRRSENHS